MVVNLPEDNDPWLPSAATDPNPSTSSTATADLHRRVSTAIASSDVDPRLIHDLHDLFPLLQSFLDQETKAASSSFTRRATMVYTKAPSLSNKLTDQKDRSLSQTVPTKKRRNPADRDKGADKLNARRNLEMEAYKEELIALRKQVEDLHKTILEKDQILQSIESINSQKSCIQEQLVELKHQSAEKDALLKVTQLQLSNMKIELADKQAIIEKKQWEVMQSNKRLEELKEALDRANGERSLYVQLFEGLMKKDDLPYVDNYDIQPCQAYYVPELDDMDDTQMLNVEEARKAYINAVADAKGNDYEDSIAGAITARLHLQSLVFQSQGGEPIWA